MKAQANGIKVNYDLTGPEGAPVVVFSHSLSATLNMWDAQMAALTDRFRVLRYDLRGHGGSEATEGAYSFDMLAQDVVALLRALEISRCHFVGLSIGGMIGQTLGLKREPEIASLTLAATTSRIPAEAQPLWDDRIKTAREKGMAPLAQPTLDRWLSKDFQTREPAETKRVLRMIETTPVAGYIGCGQAIRGLDLTDRINAIALPTLIIAGRDDPSTPPAASEVINKEIKGSKLVVLEKAMHICNIEQAQGFNRVLRDFLDGLS
jgi:3-oxoadipate enol-lactonase